jgi:hypothetical protein
MKDTGSSQHDSVIPSEATSSTGHARNSNLIGLGLHPQDYDSHFSSNDQQIHEKEMSTKMFNREQK